MRVGESTVLILWAICFNFNGANPKWFEATLRPTHMNGPVLRLGDGRSGFGVDP